MDEWQEWSADDWARHYGGETHASGQSLTQRASQAGDRAQAALQEAMSTAERAAHSLFAIPDRVASAVELQAQRAKELLDQEEGKLEKTVKFVALGAVAVVGLMLVADKKHD
jgi:hypothetical protein